MFLFLKKEDEDKDTDKISVEGAATCFFAKEWETLNHKSPNGKLYRGLLPFFSRYDFLHPVKKLFPEWTTFTLSAAQYGNEPYKNSLKHACYHTPTEYYGKRERLANKKAGDKYL